ARKENLLNDYYGSVISYIREKMELTQKDLSDLININLNKIQKLLGSSSIRKISEDKYLDILKKININADIVNEAEENIKLAFDGKLQWSFESPSIILKINQFLNWKPEKCPCVVGFNIETSLNKSYNFEKTVFEKLNKNNQLWLNPVTYSEDLEEYAFLDIIKLKPKPTLIEIKEVETIFRNQPRRWVTSFLRRTIEEIWFLKKTYGFSNAELIINIDPKELKHYAERIKIKVYNFNNCTTNNDLKCLKDKVTVSDMLKIISNYNLSIDQVAVLAGVSKHTIHRNFRKNIISSYLLQQLSHFFKKLQKDDIRLIHFDANKKIIGDLFKDKRWALAEKYPEVVYLYKKPTSGNDFESKISNILNGQGYTTILNAGLLDKNAILRTTKYLEADIFASNGKEKIIVECKEQMTKRNGNVRHQKYVPYLTSLAFSKEILDVDRAIFATKEKLTEHQKNLAKRKGVEIWDKEVLKY
ncbi:restriction endonuclease, partial [Nanoarchaeota archaeon]